MRLDCTICMPGSDLLVYQCEKQDCVSRAEYRTDCYHVFCKRHIIVMASGDTEGIVQWQCLKDCCDQIVNSQNFTYIRTEKTYTFEEIKHRNRNLYLKIFCGFALGALIGGLTIGLSD